MKLYAPYADNVEIRINDQLFEMVKDGKYWHFDPQNCPPTFHYSYIIDGHEIFDPYCPYLTSSHQWGDPFNPRSIYRQASPFDWENDTLPQHKDPIYYEMHIRGFTQDPSSKVAHPGTFLGAIEKIPYLKELGITSVELLPIQEFNESALKKPLTNYWGYATVNFFAIMNRYLVVDPSELKLFVREMHKNNLEVILDVVYNHVGDDSPLYHLDPNYFILDDGGNHTNYTGCGNTLNANAEPARSLILDSLRYLATEYHLDGFRFDLASTLTRDSKGQPLENPPLIHAMRNDPVIGKLKLISEPWDPGGLYQVGHFPANFADWNGWYRDTARKFLNGFETPTDDVKRALTGSPHLFEKKGIEQSINFITVHDGFTLHDLISYETKQNEANNENNQDGSDTNFSKVFPNEAKLEQAKNFIRFLLTSKGAPLILMGDEVGFSHNGNNNPWCQDNDLNWLNWDKPNQDLFTFFKETIALRKELIDAPHTWIEHPQLLAYTLGDKLIAFNPTDETLTLESHTLPPHSSIITSNSSRT